jgi:hypothetical protein
VYWLGAFAIRAQSVGDDFHCSGPRHKGASSLSSSVPGVSWSERTTKTTVRLPDVFQARKRA